MTNHIKKRKKLTTFQIITMGFAVIIIFGSFLLMMPVSSSAGEKTPFIDALFTSTSAVCVTGLVIYDTAEYWSMFGQLVIMILIQIGGMGVITVAAFLFILSGQRIGLMHRSTMQEALSAPKVGGIVRLAGFIIKAAIGIELIGALAMLPVFSGELGIEKGLWYSIFHSISAFCNAGFDLMGVYSPFSSLTAYKTNPVINISVIALIIAGGIGFLTWDDIRENRCRIRKYRLQSRVILCVTAVLIIVPFFYFFFCEFNNESSEERIWYSLFQSVTPRTAGFNTKNLTDMTQTGQVITIILMICGGSPGSTAGGIKTTTVAVLIAAVTSTFKKREEVHILNRTISDETVKYALTIFILYILSFTAGGILISNIENVQMMAGIFEAVSAVCTTGLSLGITPGIKTASKLILMVLMFIGRVGGLTLVFAAMSGGQRVQSRLPKEKITVG